MKKDNKKAPEAPVEEILETPELQEEAAGPEMVSVEKAKLEEASRLFDEACQQRDEYLNMAKRVQAEFDNYRKRNAALRADAEDEAIRQSVLAMLPAVDNLERALSAAEDSPLKAGVEMTLRAMKDALAKLGMEGVPAEKGQEFDPEKHNAVMTCEADDDCPSGAIAEVFQSGYAVRGKVIRYAMVKVAQ